MKFAGFGVGRESSRLSRASDAAAEWDVAADDLGKEQPGVFFTGDDAEIEAAFGEPDSSVVSGQGQEPVVASAGSGEGKPFVHMDLAGAGDEGQSETPFLGKRWRDVPDEMKVDAWEWLRAWVDWFTLTYRVQKKNIPPCWFMHSDVVEELWIAANAETKVWEEGVATVMPLTSWQNFVPGILGRLEPMVQRCVNGAHVEEKVYKEGEHPFVRPVDEVAWMNTVTASINDAVDLEPGCWRAVVVGDDEEQLSVSAPVDVPVVADGDSAGIGQVFVGPGGRAFVQAWGLEGRAVRWERRDGDVWVADELKTTSMVSAGDGLTDADLRELMDERLRGLVED